MFARRGLFQNFLEWPELGVSTSVKEDIVNLPGVERKPRVLPARVPDGCCHDC
jgi:hypothetical protein